MSLALHIVAPDRELQYKIKSFIERNTSWRLTWGVGLFIPLQTNVILISAEQFIAISRRKPPLNTNYVFIVYGGIQHLITSFLLGCDDYIKHPWSLEEVFFRIKKHDLHNLTIKTDTFEMQVVYTKIIYNDRAQPITETEYRILNILIRNKNKVIDKNSMYCAIKDDYHPHDSRIIDVYISSIRKKIQCLSDRIDAKELIQTVRKKGYLLKSNECG